VGLIFSVLSGCATEDLIDSAVAITDRADASVVGWTANESGRQVFFAEDEEVTIKVLFDFNYRGVYEWFKVEWIAPGGVSYQVVSRRTDFASHREFKASLKVRGKMASRLPGLWRVRVSLLGREGAPDRELVSRLFRIAAPTAQMIAAGLTPVDPPVADQQRPLASYSRIATHSQKKATADLPSAPSPAAELSDVKQPVRAAPAVLKQSTPPSADASALVTAQAPGVVLAPLAIMGASVAAAPATEPAPTDQVANMSIDTIKTPILDDSGKRPGPLVMPLPVESGVAAVTLRATPSDPRNPLIRTRNYVGCPPLYYRPGPGCVEQAPEE